MPYQKDLLLVGESLQLKEFKRILEAQGAKVTLASDADKALAAAEARRPDGIIFILPVYWENVGTFVEKLRENPRLAMVPVVYFGDFIEASDQLVLRRFGVHTMTLGPVPPEEAVRFIFSVV